MSEQDKKDLVRALEHVTNLPLILLCGAAPEKVPAGYVAVSMADVFAEACLLVENYWKAPAFDRRDHLSSKAAMLAERLRGHVVVCPRSNPDQDSLVQALKPFAGLVVLGLS